MKRITIIIILMLVAMGGYALAQMGMMRGRGMMAGMHDHSPIQYNPEMYSQEMRIARGGQLYDNWWKTTVDTEKPAGDHPLWKLQKTNKRSGYATFRCKECHGWDYRGKNGAYGKGSHFTGFRGVYEASKKMTMKELDGTLVGATNRDHNFSRYLSSRDIEDLVLFMKKGIVDMAVYVDKQGDPLIANINRGGQIYNAICARMCHGGPGTMINFGDQKRPEYLGTVASKNPWEFIHKVRAGQPGTKMPSAIVNNFSRRDIQDLLGYSRTLPRNFDEAKRYPPMMGGQELMEDQHLGDYRGFGPLMQ